MDINKVDEVLKKYKEIERNINDLQEQSKQLNNDLVRYETLKQQALEELKTFNITPDCLENEIVKLTQEVENDIRSFEDTAN